MRISTGTGLVIIGLIILFLAWQSGYIHINTSSLDIFNKATTTTAELNGVAVNKPLKITVHDSLKGTAVGGATIYIYKGQTLMETLTTDSSGQAVTSLSYPSGEQLNVLVVNGNSKEWVQITVPYMNKYDAQSSPDNPITIDMFTLGSYVIKVTDQFGNVYSSGGVVNFTTLGTDTITLTISIYNTLDNTGYRSSYDPINHVKWDAVLLASTTTPQIVINGFQYQTSRGTTDYWMQVIPDDQLIRQKVGTTYVKQGVASFTITVNAGSLAINQTNTVTLTLYAYFDPQHFEATGIGSNDQLALATFSLVFTK